MSAASTAGGGPVTVAGDGRSVAPGRRVRVQVPATSANLGPGYDSFGLALGFHDVVTAEIADVMEITVDGVGADSVPRDGTHLVVRAVHRAFDHVGLSRPALRMHCENAIPHGGGQGSSASAIVAGMLLARGLVVDGDTLLSDDVVLELATEMEGHPDNVAPALFGGLTVSWTRADGATGSIGMPVHPQVRLLVFTAAAELSTHLARTMLPAVVPHADAAANSAAAAVLVHALTVDPTLLMEGTRDLLHQGYRAPAMPGSAALVAELRSAGLAAVISGAGPSVLAFTTQEIDIARWERPGFVVTAPTVDALGAQVRLLPSE